MARKLQRVEPVKLFNIKAAAEAVGEKRTTLTAAIDAGHVHSYVTGSGERFVLMKDVEAWSASDRKRGPKPR